MNLLVSNEIHNYDGSQLSGGWLKVTFGVEPDGCVAFRGSCDVQPEHMIDLDDLNNNCTIVGLDMLHFIIEHKDGELMRMALRQRLFICNIREVLEESFGVKGITRTGDDLFIEGAKRDVQKRKLTVSIATNSSSTNTGLIHTGINVDFTGAPVPAIGLAELNIDPTEFATQVQARYNEEISMATHATQKVRPAL